MSGVIAASLAVSAYGAYSANKNAKAGQAAADQQAALGQQNLAYQQQMGQWAQQYANPSLQRLNEAAMSSQPLDYGLVSSQIKRRYADLARNMGGLGYGQPGTGSALRGLQLGQASDLSQAFAEGLAKRRGLQQFMAGTMTPAVMGQAGQVGRASEALGSVYGQQAGTYNQAAQQGWQAAAQGFQGALGYAGMKSMQPQQPEPVPTATNAVQPSPMTTTNASSQIATTPIQGAPNPAMYYPASWWEPKH